jgi:5-methylthioribose kinase
LDYEILDESTVARYIRGRADLASRIDADTVEAHEVGDGNLNLVFVCRDAEGRSLALKQSLPYVRVAGPSWPLTADRSIAESIGLAEAARASPETAPEYYGYDEDSHVVAMEDLSDLVVWRSDLDQGHTTNGAGAKCGRHLARLLFHTGPLGRPADEFRLSIARATNTALCKITEDLIFTEPLVDHEHNAFSGEIGPTVDQLRSDADLVTEVGRLKAEFMTRSEALVHGDFHTGSVMVDPDAGGGLRVKVIDTEFCFYGPIAFDLGVLVGNVLFAVARASVLDRAEQAAWLEGLPAELWGAFHDEFWRLWPGRLDRSFTDDQAFGWLDRIGRDTVGFAGCEAIRRVVGFAKVSDIETLPAGDHERAATAVLETARRWLVDADSRPTTGLFDAVTIADG